MQANFHRCSKLSWQGIVVSEMSACFAGYRTITMQVVLTWRGRLKRRLHPGLESPYPRLDKVWTRFKQWLNHDVVVGYYTDGED